MIMPRLVRMTELYGRLSYAKHIFDVQASFSTDGDKGEIVVTLQTEGKTDIQYTLDGSEPTAASPKYEAPLRIKGDWIMGTPGVVVKISDDGKSFKEIANKPIPVLSKDDIYPHEITFASVKARYVEVIIKSDKLPVWHGGARAPAFVFVDEISVE